MRLQQQRQARRGMVLPLVAMCTIALIGMVALAIDIGMIAVARNQCQNAADSAAMAGARTINGDSTGNYNVGTVPANAIVAATENSVFGAKITGDPSSVTPDGTDRYVSGDVVVEAGAYAFTYDDNNAANEKFDIQFPP